MTNATGTKNVELGLANAEQALYESASKLHKSCREEEHTLYNTNVKCHEDWLVAKEDMILKCEAHAAKEAEYGEETANAALMAKAPEEDVDTYVARISETVCGKPLDCSTCVVEDGKCTSGGGGGGAGGGGEP